MNASEPAWSSFPTCSYLAPDDLLHFPSLVVSLQGLGLYWFFVQSINVYDEDVT